jgi:effector-binding domain-containing protein
MIEVASIAESARQTAAVIRLTIPRSEIQAVMGPAIEELMAAVSDQGIGPRGPLFALHLAMSSDAFDFELGVPVDAPVNPVGRVKPGELPAATVARTVYRGPYEGLHDAWREFGERSKRELGERMAREGLGPGDTLWERYLVGPESNPDPGTWRTELNRPLVAR